MSLESGPNDSTIKHTIINKFNYKVTSLLTTSLDTLVERDGEDENSQQN